MSQNPSTTKQTETYHNELVALSNELCEIRKTLIKYSQNKNIFNHNSTIFPFASMTEKYSALTQKYISIENKFSNLIINELKTPLIEPKEKKEMEVKEVNDNSNVTTNEIVSLGSLDDSKNNKKSEMEVKEVSDNNDIKNDVLSLDSLDSTNNSKSEKTLELPENNKVHKYKYRGNNWQFKGKVYCTTKLYLSANEKIVKNKKIFYEWNDSKVQRILALSGINSTCIEGIDFRNYYVLVIIRKPLNTLKKNIEKLNGMIYNGHQMNAHLFDNKKKNKNLETNNREKHTLFIQNFDIVRGVHKRLTNELLQFGELYNDIKINVDRNGNPFAIAEYYDLKDAVHCFQSIRCNGLHFGQRDLVVDYAMF